MRVLITSPPQPGEHEFRFEEDFEPGEKGQHGEVKRPYAILSHAWEDEEVTFTDVLGRHAARKKGVNKLRQAIAQARRSDCAYLWAVSHTKKAHSRLSPSIASM